MAPPGRNDERAPAHRGAEWVSVLAGVGTFVAFAALLWRLVYRGWAHSFDSAIYVRSLWGVAHGEMANPLVDIHVLSVHFNLVLYALAPLAHAVHPASVLIFSQAAALGVTTWLVCRDIQRSSAARWGELRAITLAGFGAWALILCSPVVSNPFLFDIRPDALGVPLLTAGLLRARRLGDFDGVAVALMCCALFVREEYFMVIVGALGSAPFGSGLFARWRLRLFGILFALGWWALYWFGIRAWIGDDSDQMAQQVMGEFFDSEEGGVGRVIALKAEIVAILLLSMGLLAVRGWRWLGAAVPGALFVLITSRYQDLVLNFHYLYFVAPGVLVASVDGFDRWIRDEPGHRNRAFGAAVAVSALVSFFAASALPGGGRFRPQNFLLLTGASEAVSDSDVEGIAELHALARSIPPGVSTAMPWGVAAPASNRRDIWAIEAAGSAWIEAGAMPPDVEWVIVPARDWMTVGRFAVEQSGFRPLHAIDSRAALLSSHPDSARTGNWIGATQNQTHCEPTPISWPELGLIACGTGRTESGAAVVLIGRVAPPSPEYAEAAITAWAAPVVDGAPGQAMPLLAAHGIVNLRDVRETVTIALVSIGPLPAPSVAIQLNAGDVGVPAQIGDDSANRSMSVTAPLP